tara:strand:+ start:1194 stop:1856 length:663 start_codon:yes stop_codon:yes gene_type:complete
MNDQPENDGEGFVARWSRRKIEEKEPSKDTKSEVSKLEESAPLDADSTRDEGDEEKTNVDDLPDVETLNESSDYTPFLKDGVPEKLKRMALRKLWKSNPAFGFIDGLDDYDEDYSAIGIVAQEIFTNYKPGKGMVDPDETEEEIDEAVKAEGEVEPEEEARDLGEIEAEAEAEAEAEEDEVAGNEKSVEEQKVAVSDDIAEAETGDLEKPIPQNSKKASQ